MNSYNWFEKQAPIYKTLFPLCIEISYKTVFLTKDIKEYTLKKYNLSNKNMIIVPNSIDFQTYYVNNKVENIKKLLVS